MRRRDFLLRGGALAGMLLVQGGCSRRQKLNLGMHPWVGYESLYVADEFGWMPPAINVHKGEAASTSLQALYKGTVDVAALTLDELLVARDNGIPLSAILVFDVSAGADVVLGRPEIHSISQLKSKRFGVEKSAVGELVLTAVLAKAGVKRSEISIIDLPANMHLDAWQSGAIDVVITYEPTASHILNQGGSYLFDSKQMADTIFDVLAVRESFISSHASLLEELVAAHFKALDHITVNHHDALYRMAGRHGVTVDEAKRAFKGVILPGIDVNRSYLSPGSRMEASLIALIELMSNSGLLKNAVAHEGILRPDFIPGA